MSHRIYITTYNGQRFQNESGAPVGIEDEKGIWVSSFTHGLTILEPGEDPETEFRNRTEEIFPKEEGWVNRQVVADAITPGIRAGPYAIYWTVEMAGDGDGDKEGGFGEHFELGDYNLSLGSDTGQVS